MNLSKFKHDDWVKMYEGRWGFLTSTHFIRQFNEEIKFGGRPFVLQSIIFVSHGRSSGWMTQRNRDRLGHYLSKEVVRNPKKVKIIASDLKQQAKTFLAFIAKHENTVATQKLYKEFWKRLLAYYHPHVNVKYVVDYLRPDLLKKYLHDLQSARLVAEPVFNRTEDFMVAFAKLLSKKTKYDYKSLLCLTKFELQNYFKTGRLPSKAELKERDKKAAMVGSKTMFEFFTGGQVAKIEKLVNQKKNTTEIKGAVAFPGKARGIVRIVFDPQKVKVFNAGDILVAGSTRPEFLPIMKKAAAFVTDAGGILSHAAITAREMRKPCVIGTQIGTKVFKDGDVVEVNAGKGIVRKLK